MAKQSSSRWNDSLAGSLYIGTLYIGGRLACQFITQLMVTLMTATNDTNRPVSIPTHPRKSPGKGALHLPPSLWLLFRGRCSLVFLCGQIASPARQLLNFFPLFLCFLCQLFLRLGLVRSDTKIYLIHTHVSVS